MTPNEAAGALRAAGWPRELWPVMVAIGKAESGLRVDAVSPTNRNGTVDRGWLQINSVHKYDEHRLTTDPVFTAKAGLSIWHGQGLRAWSTYTNGSYRQFLALGQQAAAHPADPPAAGSSGGGGGGGVLGAVGTAAAAAGLGPLGPLVGLAGGNPLGVVKDTGQALVTAVELAGKTAAWIGNPHNWLRVVEVIGGAAGVLIALRMLASSGVGGPVGALAAGAVKAENVAGKVAGNTAGKAALTAAL